MFATVLYPIDHGRAALETAATVLKLVQQHDSRLVLLSVVEADPEGGMADPADVSRLLEQARDTFERAGVTCEVIERQGKPAFVIGDVADEIEADLIVMGTRGLTLESDETSTAARVIQLAPCPVMVVP
ncbi:MAG: universal stress protein [Prochlorococcaceae cyanobacterium]|jgi:nucleotide-binding universal stress UspA family protein